MDLEDLTDDTTAFSRRSGVDEPHVGPISRVCKARNIFLFVRPNYEVWMIAPHMSWWRLHTRFVVAKQDGRQSTSTLFDAWFTDELNRACARRTDPVFPRAVQAPNCGWMKAIESEVAMFAPNGGRFIVKCAELPELLVSMMRAQYLIRWHKRFAFHPPCIERSSDLSQAFAAHEASVTKAKQIGDGKLEETVEAAENTLLAEIERSMSRDRVAQMYAFNKALLARLTDYASKHELFRDALEHPLGARFWALTPQAIFKLQFSFQAALVDATDDGCASAWKLAQWLEPAIEACFDRQFGPPPGRAPEDDFELTPTSEGQPPAYQPVERPADAPTTKTQRIAVTPSSVLEMKITEQEIKLSYTGKLDEPQGAARER